MLGVDRSWDLGGDKVSTLFEVAAREFLESRGEHEGHSLKAILNDEAAWGTRAQPPLLKIVVDHLHSLLVRYVVRSPTRASF